jgi:hypothetical protein
MTDTDIQPGTAGLEEDWHAGCLASLWARTYSGQDRVFTWLLKEFGQLRSHSVGRGGVVCKTVGSAYVGSNPTPATNC